MTSHKTCSHAATSAARAACRRSGGPSSQESSVLTRERSAHEQLVDREEELRAMAARHGLPRPTPQERAASLSKIWCTTCHLLHDLPDCRQLEQAKNRAVLGDRESVKVSLSSLGKPDFHGRIDDNGNIVPVDEVSDRKAAAAHSASLDLPTFANARALAADIPAGRYAVRHADGEIKFYRLDKPEQGRWAGYVFLKIQSSDDELPIKSAARQMSVYGAILDAGVAESSRLYGTSIGSCGVCGRTLTDAESISKGIGPVCENKMGW